jgi:hypothetical protein
LKKSIQGLSEVSGAAGGPADAALATPARAGHDGDVSGEPGSPEGPARGPRGHPAGRVQLAASVVVASHRVPRAKSLP